MFIKKVLIIALFCSASIAQTGNYKTNNYSAWKVIKASEKDKYVEVTSMDKLKPEELNPICLSDDKMIFKYEMMGHEDSFYDKNSNIVGMNSIGRSNYKLTVFALKIDVEEDNGYAKDLNKTYDKICADNNSQRYTSTLHSHGGIDYHGVIKYIGDVTIKPPF